VRNKIAISHLLTNIVCGGSERLELTTE